MTPVPPSRPVWLAGRPHRIRVTYLAEPLGRLDSNGGVRAVVAFAAGDGLATLFESAGVTVVQTSVGRPSTAEMLAAIQRSGAAEVVVLPNARDGIAVAEAAAAEARAAGIRVAVIPTRAQVQGIAAAAVHEPARTFDADVVAMTTAAGHTRHGAVTVAVREAVTSAGVCRTGRRAGGHRRRLRRDRGRPARGCRRGGRAHARGRGRAGHRRHRRGLRRALADEVPTPSDVITPGWTRWSTSAANPGIRC